MDSLLSVNTSLRPVAGVHWLNPQAPPGKSQDLVWELLSFDCGSFPSHLDFDKHMVNGLMPCSIRGSIFRSNKARSGGAIFRSVVSG